MMQSNIRIIVTAFLLLASQVIMAQQATINDAKALGDLKTGKGGFLVDPKKLNFYLGITQGSYKGMKAQGVEPVLCSSTLAPA